VSNVIYLGESGPAACVVNVTSGTSGLDMSTITAATIQVQKADGTLVTWTGSRTNQTSSTLTVSYTFQVGDINVAGTWALFVLVTVPSGQLRTSTLPLVVKGAYEP
jgi:hypothetical protein